MGLYMLRRELRNRLVPHMPRAYRNRIKTLKNSLPLLASMPAQRGAGLAAVAEFYSAEYHTMLQGLERGIVTINGQTVDFNSPDQINWAHRIPQEGDHQMWRVKLSHMGFLCPLLAQGGGAQHELAANLCRHAALHTDMAAKGAFKGFWFPYAASHRLLALGAGLVMARAAGKLAEDLEAELATFLRLNVAFVLDNVEHELCNNHLERNLAALCLYFSYAQSVPAHIAKKLECWVAQLVGLTVLADGTQIERSPMYQGLSVVALAVMADAPFLSAPLRGVLHNHAEAAREAFAILCHPDGKVALFNDGWHGEVPRYTGPPAPDGRAILPMGGYGRLGRGGDVCLMDAGPLGPDWNPGHGHSDFLSIEISLGAERLIVDPGTSRYNTGADRSRERSAAAHNGPVWIGHEPVAFFGSFRVANLASATLFDPSHLPQDTLAGMFCSAPGVVARAVRHWPDLGWLIVDHWAGKGCGQVHWLIPTAWDIMRAKDGFTLHNTNSGAVARLDVLAAARYDEPVPASCATHYGRLDPAQSIILYPAADAAKSNHSLLTWVGQSTPPADIEQTGGDLLRLLQSLSSSGPRR